MFHISRNWRVFIQVLDSTLYYLRVINSSCELYLFNDRLHESYPVLDGWLVGVYWIFRLISDADFVEFLNIVENYFLVPVIEV